MNYQIKILFIMWGSVLPQETKVLGLYTQGLCVHGPCLSLSARVFPIQTQLWHSIHAVQLKLELLGCILTPMPPLPVSTNSHPSTRTHPVNDNLPLLPTVQHVTWVSQG